MDATDMDQSYGRSIVKMVIVSGWIISLVTTVVIIGTSVWMMLKGHELPEPLKQWAGIALGFLFGNFTNIVGDFLNSQGS